MEVSSSSISKYDMEGTALKGLLEAFGSLFSLEEIASAYCKAGRNADLAGQILYYTQGSILSSSNPRGEYAKSTDPATSKNLGQTNVKSKAIKQKWRPVSGGTVSSVLGKEYTNHMPGSTGSSEATKPLKLDEETLPMSELWGNGDKSNLNALKNEHLQNDMEDFMCKMLGDGFNLERDVIHQVLDKCGYDVQKGMDNLLDLSVGSSDKKDEVLVKSSKELTDVSSCPKEPSWYAEEVQSWSSIQRHSSTIHQKIPGHEEKRHGVQKEVLSALFNGNEENYKLSRRAAKEKRRSIALGKPVIGPPMDFTFEEPKSTLVATQPDNDTVSDENEEDGYELLLKAVKEYRTAMKEYYKAAVDAFVKGDRERANKLMDQGHFFHQKAHEADEESSQKIFETKNTKMQDEMILDLHNYGTKEAIRLLKCHISSLSGNSSFKHLKVIVETNDDEDTTKGARRRLVIKLLDKESIEWSEGRDDGTILIRLDNVNPRKLSFPRK